jgi:hypothetical protein
MVNHEHENEANGPGGFGLGILAGALIGSLAGATAMLLLAPQSGKRTRAKLQRQSHELREQTAETLESVWKFLFGRIGGVKPDLDCQTGGYIVAQGTDLHQRSD